MTLETAKAAADFLAANAENNHVPSINFFGGEPLLMWESIVVPLTEYVRSKYLKGFRLSMTSNCILMDKDKLEYMEKNQIGLLFSLDGDKETQDKNRPLPDGESSFDILKDKIPLILHYHPDLVFRATISQDTCQNTFHNLMFAVKVGYKNVFVVPNTLSDWTENERRILSGEMRKYSDYFIDCFREGTTPPTFSTLNKAFQKIPAINQAESAQTFRCSKGCYASGKCGLGASRFVSIDYQGNLYGCQEISSNEGSDSVFYIGDIWNGPNEGRRIALMKSFDAAKISRDECVACKLNRVCDGGCVAHNYLYSGSVNGVPPMHCWWERLMLDEAIYIMNTLGNEKNELFRSFWVRLCGVPSEQ